MKNRTVLISGASIAGPTLAFWLGRYGFDVTVVERAPALRDGGYKIDIRGTAVDVMQRMGLMEAARAASCDMQGATFVNAQGGKVADLPAALWGMRESRDTELMRGDLGQLLYAAARAHAQFVFGDSIRSLRQDEHGVDVTFEHGAPRRFDWVVGADGLHSHVRALAFAPESTCVPASDYYIAIGSVPNRLRLDRWELLHVQPKRTINIYSTKHSPVARALFIMHAPGLRFDARDRGAQLQLLNQAFAHIGWEAPRLLQDLQQADDFFFDTVSQVHLDTWSRGRVVLLGDAGYAPSLASGQGTSQALVGAYVLAGELMRSGGAHAEAFARYQSEMLPYVRKNLALGQNVKHMVAHNRFEVAVHGMMLKLMPWLPWSGTLVEKIAAQVQQAAHSIAMRDYPEL